MFYAILPVPEIRRLGGLIKQDRSAVKDGGLHGLYIAQGFGRGDTPRVGERPVVAIIWDTKTDLGGGDIGEGILH